MASPTNREDIPRAARRAWDEWMEATQDLRKAEKESKGFWVGGRFQWHEADFNTRLSKNRPAITINRCKPVIDQVENEARSNPPGPQCHPVGEGADKDGCDIIEGLIREYEYRSNAQAAYIRALRDAAAGMRGAFELVTEYVSDRSLDEQQLSVKEIPNPELCFFDPKATRPNREDSLYQGIVKVLSREQLIDQYGDKLKVLNSQSLMERAGGWIADVTGWRNDYSTLREWTGDGKNGPYHVCEFWRVEFDRVDLTLYDDSIARFSDEPVPQGVRPKIDQDTGQIKTRLVVRKKIKKYLVTALDVLDETDWLGDVIPIFWVLGPEMWIDKKCYRHSLISGAIDAQRGLNYAASSAAEIVGSMTKAPWVGYAGQFDVENAQGVNPWKNSNGTLWSYMEIKPVFATDPDRPETPSQLLPPPVRNTWEAPIARVLELASFFAEQVKAATSVFFEPTLMSAQKAQSGAAIKALQAQTNIGTLNWQDTLHNAVAISYQQATKIMRKLYDGETVRTIVRPDNTHEAATINAEFANTPENAGKKRNSIVGGQYSVRVTAGPNFQTRQEEAISHLMDVFKIVPQLLAMPGVAAQFLRMMGQGNPKVEQMADELPGGQQIDPQNAQAVAQQLQAENQQLKQVLGTMQQAIQSKLPEIEAKKWVAALNALAGIREAEIKAGVDRATLDASMLEKLIGMSHDRAMQTGDQQHAAALQDSQQQAAAEQQQTQLAAATQQSSQQGDSQ